MKRKKRISKNSNKKKKALEAATIIITVDFTVKQLLDKVVISILW